MDPESIQLDNINKQFEYFKLSKEVDNITCIDSLKNMLKAYIKLYYKQQEVLTSMAKMP